ILRGRYRTSPFNVARSRTVLEPALAEALLRALDASEALSQAIRDVLRSAEGERAPAIELEEATNRVQSALELFQARLQVVLSSVGDDEQLANVDLQNILQKQQQTLQMLSNISKALYDTAWAVTRKMGGG